MSLILKEAIGPDGPSPTLVLGPTAPEDLSTDWTGKVGWITFVDGTSMAHPSTDVEIISPDNLLGSTYSSRKPPGEKDLK